MMLIVAFSGGKDSTALALRLAELGESFSLLFTPTGNELPELAAHFDRVVQATGAPLVTLRTRTLEDWIGEFQALRSRRKRASRSVRQVATPGPRRSCSFGRASRPATYPAA